MGKSELYATTHPTPSTNTLYNIIGDYHVHTLLNIQLVHNIIYTCAVPEFPTVLPRNVYNSFHICIFVTYSIYMYLHVAKIQ